MFYITNMYLRNVHYFSIRGIRCLVADMSVLTTIKISKVTKDKSVYFCIHSDNLYFISTNSIYRYKFSNLQRHLI